MKNTPWSEDEKLMLIVSYPERNNDEIAKIVGRTSYAVEHKARKMHLKKSAAFMKSEKSGRRVKKVDVVGQIKSTIDNSPCCMDCINHHVNCNAHPCNSSIGLNPKLWQNNFIASGKKFKVSDMIYREGPAPIPAKVSFLKRISNFFKSSAAC